MKRNLLIGLAFVSALTALVTIERTIARAAAAQAKGAVMAPRLFAVGRPKPEVVGAP